MLTPINHKEISVLCANLNYLRPFGGAHSVDATSRALYEKRNALSRRDLAEKLHKQVQDTVQSQLDQQIDIITDGGVGAEDVLTPWLDGFLGCKRGDHFETLGELPPIREASADGEVLWGHAHLRTPFQRFIERAQGSRVKLIMPSPLMALRCMTTDKVTDDTKIAVLDELTRGIAFEILALPPSLIKRQVYGIQLEEHWLGNHPEDVHLFSRVISSIQKRIDGLVTLGVNIKPHLPTSFFENAKSFSNIRLTLDLVHKPEVIDQMCDSEFSGSVELGVVDPTTGQSLSLNVLTSCIEKLQKRHIEVDALTVTRSMHALSEENTVNAFKALRELAALF